MKAARVSSAGELSGPYRFELSEKNPPSFEEFVHEVISIIKRAKGDHNIVAVGVASPNPYTSKEIIMHLEHKPAYEHVNGKPLRGLILEAAGCNELFDINDAGAAVRGELWKGDFPKKGRHVFLTLGTGLGSAFVLDGEVIKGRSGAPAPGEIWEIPYKGKNLEESAGTTKVMVRMYKSLGGTDNRVRNGNIKRLAEIAGDSEHPEYWLARNTFKEFGRSLGTVLAHACRDFRPESFVLAGNIAKSFDLFIEEVKLSYLSQVLLGEDDIKPIFRQSKLIDTNGLLGAAYVAFVGKRIPFS